MMNNKEIINLYIFHSKSQINKLELIFEEEIKEILNEIKESYNVNEILPTNKYYLPNTFFIYDYLNYPEFVISIKDNEIIGKKTLLEFNQNDMNNKIVDMFGNTLNIKMSSDLIKLKTEFNLYKMILRNEDKDYDYKVDTINTFLEKWYNI